MSLQSFAKAAQLSVRAAVAAGLSLALARMLNLEFPIYAFIAAVIVTDLSPAQTTRLGWRRLVATVVGATCGAALSGALPPGPWAIASGVLIGMLLCSLIRMQEGAKVAGYICGIVMLSYGAEPWSYAFYRLFETILGIAVAWVISLVPKLVRIDPSESQGP
jgi:uncharacterized membrane protein YgaE (UPF0421/DUF939 family)